MQEQREHQSTTKDARSEMSSQILTPASQALNGTATPLGLKQNVKRTPRVTARSIYFVGHQRGLTPKKVPEPCAEKCFFVSMSSSGEKL